MYKRLIVCTYRINAQARNSGVYGAGNSTILLDEVSCSGNETNIFNCQHSALGSTDCRHSEDVGVICPGATSGKTPVCRNYGVVLASKVMILKSELWWRASVQSKNKKYEVWECTGIKSEYSEELTMAVYWHQKC